MNTDLHDLYAHAWAFLYPSTFEGFGMPLVEALAAGIPTACSNIEPLASIAADAALLFDPENPDTLAAAMSRLVSDGALRDRHAGGNRFSSPSNRTVSHTSPALA